MSAHASRTVTMVRDAIQRPEEPRHFMVLRRLTGTATASVGGTVVARSSHALVLEEVGASIYDPVVYFPPGDVHGEHLVPIMKTTRCPLKGVASYFDIDAGGASAEEAAWSYQEVLDFDPRARRLEGCVAFDLAQVRVRVGVDIDT